MSVTIQGYLTQAKLADALRKIVGHAWQQEELPVPGSRRRWDMAFNFEPRGRGEG